LLSSRVTFKWHHRLPFSLLLALLLKNKNKNKKESSRQTHEFHFHHHTTKDGIFLDTASKSPCCTYSKDYLPALPCYLTILPYTSQGDIPKQNLSKASRARRARRQGAHSLLSYNKKDNHNSKTYSMAVVIVRSRID
jgi:hypothetical protein